MLTSCARVNGFGERCRLRVGTGKSIKGGQELLYPCPPFLGAAYRPPLPLAYVERSATPSRSLSCCSSSKTSLRTPIPNQAASTSTPTTLLPRSSLHTNRNL